MRVGDVCAAVEAWAPAGLAYEWDRSGLRIGSPDAEVSRVVVALTATRAVYEKAKEVGAEMVVAHHPPIWRPLETLRTDNPETRLWVDFAAAGIAVYGAHTNLDLTPGGVNAVLAERLGLADTRVLLPARHAAQVKLVTFVPESHLDAVRQAVCDAGAGVIGAYTQCSFSTPGTGTFLPGDEAQPFSGEVGKVNEEPERRFETLVLRARLPRVLQALRRAHPYEEPAYDIVTLENVDPAIGLGLQGDLPEPTNLARFAEFVRTALEVDHVRYVGDPERAVRRVGVIGGSGGGEARHVPGEVDALVTGDVAYHDAVEALDRGLALVDAGHQGTEKFIVAALADYLATTLPDLEAFPYDEPEVFRLA